jgi:hypothetical protein
VVSRHQSQVEFASGHTRDERGRLFAVQLDLDASMTRGESFEHGGQVPARVVVGNSQAHETADDLALQRRLRLGLQIEHAPGVAQQHLALVRELKLPRSSDQQLATNGRLQLLDLHAHGRLRTVNLRSSARQRAGVNRGDETLQPVGLQVAHAFDYRMASC